MTPPTDVKSLLSLLQLSRKELMEKLRPAKVEEKATYQKLNGLVQISNEAVHPGWFLFKGDKLVMIHIGKESFLSKLSPSAIQKELGGEGKDLRSRDGKTANQYVYPEKGFAYSEDHDVVGFVEIFPPTTLKDYLDNIYVEVGPFIK